MAKGEVLIEKAKKRKIKAPFDGTIKRERGKIILQVRKTIKREYVVSPTAKILVKTGDRVKAGDLLTEGEWNLHQMLRLVGKEKVQQYIIREIQNVYTSQGQTINDKHIELIVRQMFSRVRVIDPGDSNYLKGQILDRITVFEKNQELKKAKKKPIQTEEVLLGITRAALTCDSFLAAASFQETTSVLTNAAVAGQVDKLRGLKENVIIGRIIPAGTGFPKSKIAQELNSWLSKKLKEQEEGE